MSITEGIVWMQLGAVVILGLSVRYVIFRLTAVRAELQALRYRLDALERKEQQ